MTESELDEASSSSSSDEAEPLWSRASGTSNTSETDTVAKTAGDALPPEAAKYGATLDPGLSELVKARQSSDCGARKVRCHGYRYNSFNAT